MSTSFYQIRKRQPWLVTAGMKTWSAERKREDDYLKREGADDVQRKFKETVLGHSAGQGHTHTHQLSLGMKINLVEHLHLQSWLVDAFCIPNTNKHTYINGSLCFTEIVHGNLSYGSISLKSFLIFPWLPSALTACMKAKSEAHISRHKP